MIVSFVSMKLIGLAKAARSRCLPDPGSCAVDEGRLWLRVAP